MLVQLTLIITRHVRDLLAHFVGDLAEIDKVVSHVDQLWRGVRSEAGNLHATAFVRHGIHRVNKILVTRHEHCRVVTTGKGQHVYGDLDVEICFPGAVVKGFQFFLNHAETITSHPEQKSLLTLGADVDTGVEERSQKPSIAKQHPQEFVVIDIDVMEPRRMKKIVTVNKNRDSSPMT